MTEHTLPDEKYFIELHSPEWNAAILKMFGGSVRGCTICGHPFKQGLSCDHCGEMSPHVSLNSRNANGYPDVAVYPRAPIQAAQDYLHEGRGFNCGWCGQRFAETQHGKFCANSDCTKSPSYKPPQAAQYDVRDDDLNWRMCGIIELAIRNPNVSSYMDHWEGRALKAEAALSKDDGLLEALNAIAEHETYDYIQKYKLTPSIVLDENLTAIAKHAIAAAASKVQG